MIGLFASRGRLVSKDVSPWQTFSGRGMKFHLQSYDWNGCASVSHLSMKAFLGLMTMETVICTPYAKDLPLFSFDSISAFGKNSPSTFKEGDMIRLSELAGEMTSAYLDLFASARDVERSAKMERNRAYVEGLIRNGGPAINAVRKMLGDEPAETLFRKQLFGTD